MQKEYLVFVYGTLRRGGANHGLLEGAQFISEAATEGKYTLLVAPETRIPYLAPEPHRVHIHGELYAVNSKTLADLDHIEGHPHHYLRVQIPVVTENGMRHEAMVYLWLHHADTGYDLVETGDFRG